MKAFVDQDTCIGCGLCADLDPEVFEMTPDGKACAYKEVANDDSGAKAAVDEAIEACPVSAISWEE